MPRAPTSGRTGKPSTPRRRRRCYHSSRVRPRPGYVYAVLLLLSSASWRKWTYPQELNALQTGSAWQLSGIVRSQGGCGSCWAMAATAVLEARMEANATIMGSLRQVLDSEGRTASDSRLSGDAVTHCTKNPRNCGGTGGCDGATTELAFDMMKESGVPLQDDFGGECSTARALVGITGYEVLPSNKQHPLLQALFESGGPIAVSVDASTWFGYHAGIFSDTTGGSKAEFVINHAVTLTGYKMPKGTEMGYWRITLGAPVGARTGSSDWR
ncbi:unnamed protein product [Prorocentrum cordatum]|uniref:Peptidase C1A papain C-terminal domain-containing protein n=1 Tax=Prorocentrum cordatum TaxID=2364126 RepID=A0ABN9Q5T9_9DINO|nr:unnamed protein product [Polarella glacialis]